MGDHLGAEYDTCSVMHYGSTAFAKSWGLKTIVPKHATRCKLGQRDGFSDTDIRKINTPDECKKNPSWMLTNCPVACDQCGNKCVDNNQHCEDWADMGECDSNPEYMNIYCAKACKRCRGQCEDEKKDCKNWASKGYCKSGLYVDYMNLRCKKSCKKC